MTQTVAPDCRMVERRFQVDQVVVATAVLANVEHARAAQVTDYAPDRTAGQGKVLGEVLDSCVWVGRDVEKDRPVPGKQRPVAASISSAMSNVPHQLLVDSNAP